METGLREHRFKLPRVVIVGRPNVGKSSLFNRIAGKRVAVVQEKPGITRDRLYEQAEWNGRRFEIVDTGGILFGDDDPLVEQIRVQAEIALSEADVVVFVVDAVDGVVPPDEQLAEALRSIEAPVLVAVNKSDSAERDALATDFYRLGIGEVFPISALHNRGIAQLLDKISERLPAETTPQDDSERSAVRIAIVGRPNVGKSSILNALSGQQRVIVSEIPGTTRDAVDMQIEICGEPVVLVDTAGIRRRGKIQGSVEYYMVLRAERAMQRSDVAMIVLNGSEHVADGDKRIAKAAHDLGKACVLCVNKWDLVEPPDGLPQRRSQAKKRFANDLRDQLPEVGYAPICFVSAAHATGLKAAVEACLEGAENQQFRIPTGALNRLIREAVFERPLTRKGKSFKIYYATQSGTAPPTFTLFCNDPDLVHFSYERYLLNSIRKQFPLEGAPIRLMFRSSHEKSKAGVA